MGEAFGIMTVGRCDLYSRHLAGASKFKSRIARIRNLLIMQHESASLPKTDRSVGA